MQNSNLLEFRHPQSLHQNNPSVCIICSHWRFDGGLILHLYIHNLDFLWSWLGFTLIYSVLGFLCEL